MIRAGVIALALTGCYDVYKALHHDHPSFDNRSQYPDQFFLHVWAETEALAKTDVSLSGMSVVVHEDAGDFADACPDIEGLGCSDADNINIRGSVGTNAIDVGTEVAHQLGHTHFWKTEDGDGRHSHAEWFGNSGFVEQMRELLEAGGIR
jgi:hypothetical protein